MKCADYSMIRTEDAQFSETYKKRKHMEKIKVLVVGCGNMGASHARAYNKLDGFEIVGIVDARKEAVDAFNESVGGNYKHFFDYAAALAETKPDAVAICTYPATHEPLAIQAMEAGCHVFVEKPIASTVEGAERVIEASKKYGKKVLVGYILRHHPSWQKFIELSHKLGKPLVMRMNLNQQSHGKTWEWHKNLLTSLTPVVDCGCHYVDVMCQMTGAKPVRVSGISARVSDEIPENERNYGQLQVVFDDGSVGWYEAGWGPMISTNAFFVKDVFGPKGCVSICAKSGGEANSDDINSHTKTNELRFHSSEVAPSGEFAKPDEWFNTQDEPDHDGLCTREQEFFRKAIVEDIDMSQHLQDALNSLKIVLAADESAKTGKVIDF